MFTSETMTEWVTTVMAAMRYDWLHNWCAVARSSLFSRSVWHSHEEINDDFLLSLPRDENERAWAKMLFSLEIQ